MSKESGVSVITAEESAILQQSCEEAGVPSDIVEMMIAAETLVFGMGRRHKIWEMLELLVNKGVQREIDGIAATNRPTMPTSKRGKKDTPVVDIDAYLDDLERQLE